MPQTPANPLTDATYLRAVVDKTAAMQHTAHLALADGDLELVGQVLAELCADLAPIAAAVGHTRPGCDSG